MLEQINQMLGSIKKEKPLILNLTNDVTMDFIANGLLSLGASPVMSQSEKELEDLIKYAQALVINIGTLEDKFIALCHRACLFANQYQKPIVIDPVGAGATQYRTQTCLELINHYAIAIVRGNASEISSLANSAMGTKGVDSTLASDQVIEQAKLLAAQQQHVIVISGATDFIVNAHTIHQSKRGSDLMPMITGTGCLFSAVIAAFHAVEKNPLDASHAATIFYGLCGEIAAETAAGPGSFKTKFIDALNCIPSREQYEKH